MMRHCDGSDVNLLMIVNSNGTRLRTGGDGEKRRCDCGLTFDDTQRECVWPHRWISKMVDP